MAKNEDYTGAALEKALKSGELGRPGVELVGMMKASDRDGYVAFAPADCDHWVQLPTALIQQAERVGTSRCRGHVHPIFRLTLAEGQSPESKAYAELLAAASGRTGPAQGPDPVPGYAGFGDDHGTGYRARAWPPAAAGPRLFERPGDVGRPMDRSISGFGAVAGSPWGSASLARSTLTYCRNPRPGWLVDDTICGDCAEFRIVCLPGFGCRPVRVSGWRTECWAEALAD